MAKIPMAGPVTIAQIAAEFQGPEDLAELSKKAPLNMSGTEEVSVDDFRGKILNGMVVSGGNQTYDQGGYRYHKFTSNGTLTVDASDTGVADEYVNIECLLVSGGGGAGCTYSNSSAASSGGGGGGGIFEVTKKGTTGSFAVTVGAGGVGLGKNGGASTIAGFGTVIGGGGGSNGSNPSNGSGFCGGGMHSQMSGTVAGGSAQGGYRGGSGIFNGFNNSDAGGGGGAGQAGGNGDSSDTSGGYGGNGKAAAFDGVTYCGGGGAAQTQKPPRNGGSGGGGNAGEWNASEGTNGTNGLGGGAGTSGLQPANKVGGSGVVIIRYKPMPNTTRSISPASVDARVIEGPPYAKMPEYDPSTHKPVAEQWVDPYQKEIGWTIVELTNEEMLAYAKAQEEMESED